MSQITLRKVPDKIDSLIRLISKKQNRSINKTIINLLEKALGLKDNSNKKRNLSKFAGTWSKVDFAEFEENTKIFNEVDKEIWK